MKFVLTDAKHIDYFGLGLEIPKQIKNYKTYDVTKHYKDNDYNATIVYTIIEINTLEELTNLTKEVGSVVINELGNLPGGILDEVDGSLIIYNDYLE